MDTELLASLGFPPKFTVYLLLRHEEQQLHRYSLPEFIAIWKRYECERVRENGDAYMQFGNFTELRAVAAEIGGTIGSTSNAEFEELLKLTTVAQESPPTDLSQSCAKQAQYAIDAYSAVDSRPLESLFHLLTVLFQWDRPPDFPELAEAKNLEQRVTTMISLEKHWPAYANCAFNGFNIGLAIAKLYPDFYYSMEEFNPPTAPGANRNKQSQWPIKRELYLAQCHIWAQLCRPDLAHLIPKT